MLNVESRKFFNRAFSTSGSALNYLALHKDNHIEQIRSCAQANDTDQMLKYLKTTSNRILANCHTIGYYSNGDRYAFWLPTIESDSTKEAFMTKTPEEIYNSDLAPAMDAMFGMTSYVYIEFRSLN